MVRKYMVFLIALTGFAILLTVLSFSNSVSLPETWLSKASSTYSSTNGKASTDAPIADGIPLRIMCLGASVVKGEVSNGTVGFRKSLRESLVAVGNPVNMVGAEKVGDSLMLKDNDVEARGGNRMDEVHYWASLTAPTMKPNLYLIHVGTNDCLQHYDTPNYYKRLNKFVNFLLDASPRASVLTSTLLTNTVQDVEPCVLDLNRQMRVLYEILKAEGKPFVLAEMDDHFVPAGDALERPHVRHITPDGTHPNDEGYEMMAKIFMQSIREIDRLGYFQRPEEVPGIMDDGDAQKDASYKEQLQNDIKTMKAELDKDARETDEQKDLSPRRRHGRDHDVMKW